MQRTPVTVSESARRAECSEGLIRIKVDRGEIEAIRTSSGMRLVDPESLEAFIARRRARKLRR